MSDKPEPKVRTMLVRRRQDVVPAGIVVAAILVMVVGVAAANGASPGPAANPSGAAPSAKAQDGDKDKTGRDRDGKIRGFSLPGFAIGKGGVRGQAGGAQITITAIDGSKVSLKTADGWTRTVTLTDATKVMVGSQAGKAADLKVGDQVRLRQQRNADGTFTVLALVIEAPRAAGSVTAVGPNSITVKKRDGSSVTITLNGSTKFAIGKTAAAKSDVQVGSRIVAEGTGTTTSLTATIVRIEPTLAAGVVTAKTATSITIKQRDGSSLTIHVDAKTTYRVRGAATKPGTLADIKVGDRLIASGTSRADKSLDALSVGAAAVKAPKAPKPKSSDAPSG
jgi:hypothetical protein